MERNDRNMLLSSLVMTLVCTMMFLALASAARGNDSGQGDFHLPPLGGGMVHGDPQLTDNIRMPVPTINATDDVGEVWYHRDFGGEKYGTYGIGISGNGRIAACSFGLYDFFGTRFNPNDNLILYDYDGNRLWSSGYWGWFNKTQYPWSLDPSACGSVPMIDQYNRVVACDMEKVVLINASDLHNIHIDWISYFPEVNLSVRNFSMPPIPLSPTIVENRTIIVPTWGGPLYAFDVKTGARLASVSFWDNSSNESSSGRRQFGTQNSACVSGDTVYLTTQFPPPNLLGRYRGTISGRLYAVEVNPDATNPSDILKVAWYYPYLGQGQASPTLINGTVYFDAFNGNYTTLNGSNRNPRIYAVYTNGTLRWKINYSNITGFSFAMDPRGGFWYIDMGIPLQGGGGRKLVHFSAENGTLLEEINVSELLHDPEPLYPVSCMTIAGTATHPIMIVSVNHLLFHHGKWVIAINLTDHTVLWKVPIESASNFNFASGQYTILNESFHYRVLFNAFSGGVMAIGSYPNDGFDTISFTPWDSSGGGAKKNDSVNITFSIRTPVRQNHVWVKAFLISQEHPSLCRYNTVRRYTGESINGTHTITMTLPRFAPEGRYVLKVYLYNLPGKLRKDFRHLADMKNFGIFANDTFVSDVFSLYPSNNNLAPLRLLGSIFYGTWFFSNEN